MSTPVGTHTPEILVSTPAGCAGEEDGAIGLEGIRLEARVIQEAPQLVWVEKFDATGGEEALEAASALSLCAQDAHDGEPASAFEDAVRLSQDPCGVAELVEGAAADCSGESTVEEGDILGVGPDERRLRPGQAGAAVGLA